MGTPFAKKKAPKWARFFLDLFQEKEDLKKAPKWARLLQKKKAPKWARFFLDLFQKKEDI